MDQGKLRKIIIELLALYTILTFFFLFAGFGRFSLNHESGLRYRLMPEGIPLHFPMGRDFRIWLFELGNFAAFIPFGLFIPLLFRCTFARFIGLFILGITIVELLQMVSRLGSFDINDIIINTLGAAVGYGSQRLVKHHRDSLKGLRKIVLTAIILSLGTIAVVGGANHYLDNVDGDVIALNELVLKDGSVLWDESLTGFTAAQTKIEPQFNLYSRKNGKNNEFSYVLNGQYAKMAGYVAIPDDAGSHTSMGRFEIVFIADGTEIYSLGLEGGHQPDSFQIPLQGVDELTIKLYSDDPSSGIAMWDITVTKANTGQKIINRIRSLF